MLLNMLTWLLFLAIHGILITAWPFSASNNGTLSLIRRECTYRSGSSTEFDCDFNLPTIPQIVAHFRDSAHGGNADDTHSALL